MALFFCCNFQKQPRLWFVTGQPGFMKIYCYFWMNGTAQSILEEWQVNLLVSLSFLRTEAVIYWPQRGFRGTRPSRQIPKNDNRGWHWKFNGACDRRVPMLGASKIEETGRWRDADAPYSEQEVLWFQHATAWFWYKVGFEAGHPVPLYTPVTFVSRFPCMFYVAVLLNILFIKIVLKVVH